LLKLEGSGEMSRPKGSNSIRTAGKVIRAYLLWMRGVSAEKIAKDLNVSKRMVYYYVYSYTSNSRYYNDLAKKVEVSRLIEDLISRKQ